MIQKVFCMSALALALTFSGVAHAQDLSNPLDFKPESLPLNLLIYADSASSVERPKEPRRPMSETEKNVTTVALVFGTIVICGFFVWVGPGADLREYFSKKKKGGTNSTS